jgi:hypothetical protein
MHNTSLMQRLNSPTNLLTQRLGKVFRLQQFQPREKLEQQGPAPCRSMMEIRKRDILEDS